MDWFAGKTAVVTGAAHGIGRAIAEQLAGLGAQVVAVDRDRAGLASAFGAGPIRSCVGDVASDAPEDLLQEIIELAGPPHLLVNNVGFDTPHGFLDLDERDFDRVLGANLRGPWFLTRAIAAEMVSRTGGGGSILFVSSLHDHIVRRRPHYSASKAAVAMLVRELAHELGPHGIRVNAISPGAIASASVPAPSPEEAQRLRELVRLGGQQGRPEHVARMAAVLLCDHWAGYVTGANLPVDGGLGLVTWSQP
ncbi:MAG TPA: SDR family oxidoreductase [Solirubrobacteraceae bacterium]|jgi:NAD(P)-dependent dehydrogenase (short-subunit alcohol dehydrogenase family)